MSATRLLQLPSLLRANLGWRRDGLYATGYASCLLPHGKLTAVESTTRCDLAKQRGYATVHDKTADKERSQSEQQLPALRPNVPKPSRIKTLTGADNTPASDPSHSPAQTTVQELSPAEQREKDRLVTILSSNAPVNSARRRNYRASIRQALKSNDQLSALRLMVERSPKLKLLANLEESPAVLEQLIDFEYVQRNQPLPAREDYPTAPLALFQPNIAAVGINTLCTTLKLSWQTEVDFTSRKVSAALPRGRQDIKVCTLRVSIPDVSEVTATGEGFTKSSAKQAAWLLVVSKMHVSGTLKKLLPTTQEDRADSSLPEPAFVDGVTMESEKDAKTDIYNYAAGFGMIPVFQTQVIQTLTRRQRLGQNSKQKKQLYHVNIKLLGQDIDVTTTGSDPSTAEVAACIAFKEKAEHRLKASNCESSSPTQTAYSILNIDTARHFFDFWQSRQSGVNLEVEHELLVDDYPRHTARLTVNGEAIGDVVAMPTKKKAESVAFLVAAVELAASRPGLLDEFVQFKKRKGKILRPLDPVSLEIDYNTLQTMQQALIDAKHSGLPDERQSLTAEPLKYGTNHSRRLRRLSAQEHKSASAQLKSRQQAFNTREVLASVRLKKATLPMNHHRQQVTSMIGSNQYSIILGETGSGKTTQVPQILFEEAIQKGVGSSCNIICTQPRRIAATSLAQRVAMERDEALRDNVGYQVRFDAQLPRNPYGITYCTTGVLLERLKHNTDVVLDGISHIIIDEVHERDLIIDYVLIMLKRAIAARQAAGRSTPKVVLMSATLDATMFAAYLKQDGAQSLQQPCPVLRVPGRTFPVKEQYLGSIMHELLEARESELKMLLHEDKKSDDYLKIETEFSASRDAPRSTTQPETIIDWKREHQSTESESEEDKLQREEKEEALVPTSLIASTIAHICNTSQEGAILVFLPGIEEILDVKSFLLKQKPFSLDFTNEDKFRLCMLHSSIPKEEQDQVFLPVEPGRRKIILSTNIAETSITVPDVTHVVDTGKLRETRYDQVRRITRLQCVWESKSNLKQRAGRAGRVQEGFYYGLFSKERADSLRAVGLPELLRVDLQETCLSVEAQNFGEPVASFLGKAIEPPPQAAINAAINNLKEIGCLTSDEQLTALGRVLSKLSVHPTLGKMIILGVIFKCLDPMVLLGAAAEDRPLFVTPPGLRQEADKAHRRFTEESKSDHIGFLKAFEELRAIQDQLDTRAAARHGQEHYLHMGAFRNIQQAAGQIVEILESSGLIQKQGRRGVTFGPIELNQNATNYELIKALLVAGVYPNLAAKLSTKGVAYRTAAEPTLMIHPSSVNSELRKKNTKFPAGTLLTFSKLSFGSAGNSIFMRDSTPVQPLIAALFGGELRMTNNGQLEMDDWLTLNVEASFWNSPAKLILEFRKALDRVLHRAFDSLAGAQGVSETSWADDPVRDQFANRVVEILQKRSGSQFRINWHAK